MTFNPRIWYPIAVVIAFGNVIAAGFASGEPWHAGAHAAGAVVFGLWAQRLRRRRDQGDEQTAVASGEGDRIEALEDELTRLRHELSDAQERLDFTERMLAQRPDPRRVEPQR